MRNISNVFRATISRKVNAAVELTKGASHHDRTRRGTFDGDARQKDRPVAKPCGATYGTFGCSTVL